MSRNGGAVCCVQGQTFTRTSTLGAGWGEYTHLCTSVHEEAETLGAIRDEEKATWYQARSACRR